MKIKEIRELATSDLVERIQTETTRLQKLRLDHSITPLENPSEIKATRRDIARMKTVLRQRELNIK